MAHPGPGAHLQLHQPLGGEADHLTQDIRVGGLLHKRAKVHHLVGHWGFLGCVEFATRPYRKIANDRRKPLARYGAMGSALRERLAPAELHHQAGHHPDYRPKGDPRRVNVHDFEDKKLGKVVPYGVYDVTANAGFVSVGITSDTAEFAVASIRCWLERMGRQRYPQARQLTITADCGGSNGARVRLWKLELQKLADETGLAIHVHHYPPGTSKWNKIEHRLFCHITQNWRGRPLTDRLAVVELIGATTTNAGLKVESALDTRRYQKGIKVSNAAMKRLDITGDQFHPEWNYTIKPRPP